MYRNRAQGYYTITQLHCGCSNSAAIKQCHKVTTITINYLLYVWQ